MRDNEQTAFYHAFAKALQSIAIYYEGKTKISDSWLNEYSIIFTFKVSKLFDST
jgi:hypothetical protein